jgi:hypothetical protein
LSSHVGRSDTAPRNHEFDLRVVGTAGLLKGTNQRREALREANVPHTQDP